MCKRLMGRREEEGGEEGGRRVQRRKGKWKVGYREEGMDSWWRDGGRSKERKG